MEFTYTVSILYVVNMFVTLVLHLKHQFIQTLTAVRRVNQTSHVRNSNKLLILVQGNMKTG